ncbi:MAG: acyltransferase [Rhodocyclaceae bacterium]|nr:acyltransferase [Rhodocyclaceae bacterium]HMV56147.1 acyltransferase [Nitrospira sp.]
MDLRRLVKRVVFGLCWLVISPVLLLTRLERLRGRSESMFLFFSQAFALLPGLPGVYLRAAYYFSALDACSWENHVGFGSVFSHRGASLGRSASLGSYCVIGHAEIGDGAMIASRVSIPSGKRQHFDENGGIIATPRFDRVAIGRRCWIGEGAIVMANLGDGCVVSAGSVVLHQVPSARLVAGNPAQVVRELPQVVGLPQER